ncbi:hypothetical protein Ciccas_013060, partial [Cichlidogyrus casuarinus]
LPNPCQDNEFEEFLKADDMVFLAAKMLWVHVDVPGQGDNEDDLPSDFEFPSLDQLAEGVFDVCQKLNCCLCALTGSSLAFCLAKVLVQTSLLDLR